MADILLIETATPVCSVALARDGKVLALVETAEADRHASLLTVFIGQCLRDAGVEGTVTLTYTVDEKGSVRDVTVSRASGSRELDECAVRAVKRWKFDPAVQDGQPRAFRMSTPFRFRIGG